MTGELGLRERKKQATREALGAAALRLALERGPENVRVDDIAEAAGVSPRTYNNYFSSREQAIVAAVVADRAAQLAAAVAVGGELGDAVIEAVVGLYGGAGDRSSEALLMITATPALRACYVDTVTTIEEPLAAVIAERRPAVAELTAQVLAASVAAAVKVALERWLRSASVPKTMPGFVVATGSLPELVRAALQPLKPALDAV